MADLAGIVPTPLFVVICTTISDLLTRS